MIAVKAGCQNTNFPVSDRRGQIDSILESFGVVTQLRVKIGVARPDQRINTVNAGNIRLASGAQGCKLLAQFVVEFAVSHADRRFTERHLVRPPDIIQAGTGRHCAQARHIAQPQRIVKVDGRAQAVLAGIAVAGVVCVDAAAHESSRRHLNDQVGGSGCSARNQCRFDVDSGNVGEQQKTALQWIGKNRVAAVHAGQKAVGHVIGQPGLVAQNNLAILALAHRNGDCVVLDVLCRKISVGREVAIFHIVGGDFGRQAAQFGKREIFS